MFCFERFNLSHRRDRPQISVLISSEFRQTSTPSEIKTDSFLMVMGI